MKDTQTGLVDSESRATVCTFESAAEPSESAAKCNAKCVPKCQKCKSAPLKGCTQRTRDELPAGRTQRVRESSQQRGMRPILKWVGGKGRLVPELLKRIPKTPGRYFEPFAGGAALFFALRPERAVIADANEHLITTYEQIAFNVEPVIEVLQRLAASHCEGRYSTVRDQWNRHYGTDGWRAAAFLYLNRACFNGIYRVNADGEFNVPSGKHDELSFDFENIRAASDALAAAELRYGDYRATTSDATAGDVVYLDPPYDGTYDGYTTERFNHRELAAHVHQLADRGCHVLVSNSNTPLIRELYAGLNVETVSSHRSVNADGAGRGVVDELLISNQQRKGIAMPRQAELPGVESPDRIKPVEDAIYDLLDAQEEQRRASADARDNTKNKQAALEALFAEHAIDSHPYTCPKTDKPKRFWFSSEKKPKTASASGERSEEAEKKLENPDDDTIVTAKAEKIESRRVRRTADHDKVSDPFGATRSLIAEAEQKQADAPLTATIGETSKAKGKKNGATEGAQ